jgi:protein arginine N-methyltransferase 2
MVNKPYFQQKLTYTNDTLLDENGNAVMMEWEREIMRRQAATVCQRGGRVLNIGHGMGIIDSYIQEHDNITEHWIIEPHPDVQKHMMETGWLEKAKCIFKPWQEVINYLPKFDGIYIDTWDEDLTPFYIQAQWLLKPNGVMSVFNNPRADEEGLHMDSREWAAFKTWANVEFETFEIPYITPNEQQRTDGAYYWDKNQKIYYNPTITHNPESQQAAWRVEAEKFMKEQYSANLQGKRL